MKKTELVFVLDRSGSMEPLAADSVGGFNTMLKEQKKLSDPCRVTTVLFNQESRLLHDRVDLEAVEPMKLKDFHPSGCTALLDAVGETIVKIERVQEASGKLKADKVVFVIMTDGYENASHLYSYKKIQKMIQRHTKKDGWEFIFLGANIDAASTAGELGIAREHAVDYVPDAKGTELNFTSVSQVLCSARMEETMDLSGLDMIRKDFKKRGNQH